MAGTFTAKYKDLMPIKEDVWIESGTYRGAGVANALRYGFSELHTIEVSPTAFKALETSNPELCVDPKIHRYLGSSRAVLRPILQAINPARDVVFWLDGHYSGEAEQRDSVSECPLMAELDAILQTLWRGSVLVCIDDAYLFDDAYWTTGTLRGKFTASDWPRISQLKALMEGWRTHREDDILYFWRDFRV